MASLTVKKRIRICGRPAVPNIMPSPKEIASTGLDSKPPGAMIALPLACTAVAPANMASVLKPKCLSTMNAMKLVPNSSITALMICTQVVASMPPKVT
ncbi:hypothetical protein D3C76_1662820 [compost metagenome]